MSSYTESCQSEAVSARMPAVKRPGESWLKDNLHFAAPRTRRILLVVIGWVVVSLFFTFVRIGSGLRHQPPFLYVLYSTSLQYAFWAVAFPVISMCVRRFPLDQEIRLKQVFALIAVALLLALFTSLGYLAVLSEFRVSGNPPLSMFPTLLQVLDLRLFRFLQINLLFAIVLILVLQGFQVWKRLRMEQLRAHELQRQLSTAQLETLRMQIHPHFLFNTLHSIASLVSEQPSAARRMLAALGEFLRMTLTENTAPLRSLGEELRFSDLYLGVERLRLGDRLILNYDIDPDSTRAQVPYLLLQPLFENAVRHGAARITTPCEIKFRASRQDQVLHVSLENDGPRQSNGSRSHENGIGIRNVRERLQLHYGNNFQFEFENRPAGGALVRISLPYQERSE